jgi:methylmalonyl-CoA mutase
MPESPRPDAEKNLFSEFGPTDYETWKEAAIESLKGAPFEKKVFTPTYEGITLSPMYWPKDVEALVHAASMPGLTPFVRHGRPAGYLDKPWGIAQKLDEPLPEAFNEVLLHDLTKGQTALTLGLDSTTAKGLDADAAPDKAPDGLALCTPKDFAAAFDSVDFANLPLICHAGANSLGLLAFFAEFVQSQGRPTADLNGIVGADPLGVLAVEGSLPVNLEDACNLLAAAAAWAGKNAPNLRTVFVNASNYHNAGASAVEELGFALATGVFYARQLVERGLSADDAAMTIGFEFSLGRNFFMEIAKLRAARLVWSQVMEAIGAGKTAQRMVIHGRTSWWTKTKYDPFVNMLRNTTEVFAGAMGGADTIEAAPFDEPVRPAGEFSRRVSRNLQILLQQESHFVQPIDPSGGSWAVESLTHELASKAWELFRQVEGMGSMAKAILQGFCSQTAQATALARKKDLYKRKESFIGTNLHPNPGEKPLSPTGSDPAAVQERRAGALKAFRTGQDAAKVNAALAALGQAPDMEKALDAVKAGATLGQVTAALYQKAAPGQKTQALVCERGAVPFEKLRESMDAFVAAGNSRPKIFLANIGPIPQHKARADFSTGFFASGGFEMVRNKGFEDPSAAAQAFAQSGAAIAVICSTDKVYPEVVPALVPLLKQAVGNSTVLLAGRPAKELEQAYKDAGLDGAIYLGADCYTTVKNIQQKCGVSHE